MKALIKELWSSLACTLVFAIVCCGIYPIVVFAVGQTFFKEKANGSLIVDSKSEVRGSYLIGQSFSSPQYFHSRPSAAGNGYDASNSSGSNLGPTSQKLNDLIKDRIAIYRSENGLKPDDPVPADAVTASGSGLDPHISLANAEIQLRRVAATRRISEGQVRKLIKTNTDAVDLGIFGEPGVNVLKLNLALDRVGR